ncbi:MAG: hypothetical protein AAF573_10805 [Bacteroidota bacterium]
MKIRNLTALAILILIGVLNAAFVNADKKVKSPTDRGVISFAQFLSYFEKTELPFEVGLDDLEQYEKFKPSSKTKKAVREMTRAEREKMAEERIAQREMVRAIKRTDFIPEISYGRFSRMGPPTIQPVARFYPNEKSVAVVYATLPRFESDIHENYRMVIYDLKGNMIFPKSKRKSKKQKQRKENIFPKNRSGFELGYSTTKNTITFKIDKKGRIWKTTFENVWKEDLKKTALEENELVSFNVKDTEVFQISELGITKLKSIPTSARASLD